MTPGVLLVDETGRVCSATPAAQRMLDQLTRPDDLHDALRSVAGRLWHGDDSHSVVVGLGSVVLTAARAGRHAAVIVESDEPGDAVPCLTARESEVFDLARQGLPTKRIALALGISVWTVQQHLTSIYAKAGVCGRSELAALARRRIA